jgi:hypothetical protein
MVTIHDFWIVFKALPLYLEIGLIGAILFFVPAINTLLIFPIVFKYYIIPNIEKRLGTKIVTWPVLMYAYALGRFTLPSALTAKSIFRAYLRYKFQGYSGEARGVLSNLGYSIKIMTKFEIVMSFLVQLNFLSAVIAGIIALILRIMYPQLFH